MKQQVLRLLARMHLLGPAYRGYERVRATHVSRGGAEPAAADGLPVPPARLIMRVAGTSDVVWFLRSGRLAADSIRAALARANVRIDDARSILDFGCGCGRVVRNWANVAGDVAGSDLSPEAVEWCREHLRFARFETNGLAPPLAFEDEAFDVAYALSVFTHLPEPIQLEWMDELARVTQPGAHVIVTTHGERYRERLDPAERERFDCGELVVRWAEVPGTNLCTAFHPPGWVRERLVPRGFEEVAFVAEGAAGNPYQDLFLLRRSG